MTSSSRPTWVLVAASSLLVTVGEAGAQRPMEHSWNDGPVGRDCVRLPLDFREWQGLYSEFDCHACLKTATHVVVVDRHGLVLEVWRGEGLVQGDRLPVVEL